MTDTAGTAIAVLAAPGAAGTVFGLTAAVTLSLTRLLRATGPGATLAHWQPWALLGLGTAGRPHNLHTGCAAPAPHPALLGTSTGPVATEDEHHSAAAAAADATAHPGRNAVA